MCSAHFSNAALNSDAGGGGPAACAEGAWGWDAVPCLPRLSSVGAAAELALTALPPEGAPVGLSSGSAVGTAVECCPLLAAVGAAPSAAASIITRSVEQVVMRL